MCFPHIMYSICIHISYECILFPLTCIQCEMITQFPLLSCAIKVSLQLYVYRFNTILHTMSALQLWVQLAIMSVYVKGIYSIHYLF